jgi:hypothetical protein
MIDETLTTHVEHIVAQAPPLTDDQRNRISALLRGGKRRLDGEEHCADAK